MACPANTNSRYHVRSVSFPSRSHTSSLEVEEELNKLTTWEASSSKKLTTEAICIGLSGLEELYKCMDDLLHLPSTQQALSHHQHKEWVNELLDGSVRLLDICSITRDNILQIKEHIQVIQFALRRRKGDSSLERDITNYVSFRKEMKKDVKKMIATLKQMDQKFGASLSLENDHHLSSLIKLLREVSIINISIFHSLLLFLSPSESKPKPNGWSLVSKLMNKRVVGHENKMDNVSELESVDCSVSALIRYNSCEGAESIEKAQIVNSKLKGLEISTDSLENGLEFMFRCLIKSRASLLNIISQ